MIFACLFVLSNLRNGLNDFDGAFTVRADVTVSRYLDYFFFAK